MEWTDEVRLSSVLVKHETEKALLVLIEDEEQWIPKSVVSDNSEVWKMGDEGELVIAEWFAVKAGLV